VKMRSVSLFLLTICLSATVPALADSTLYTSGAYSGTQGEYNLVTYAFSDPFTVPANSEIDSLTIVYWDTSSQSLLSSLSMAITSSYLPGSGFETLTDPTNTPLNSGNKNGSGYYLEEASFTFSPIAYSGSGYLTLEDAVATGGSVGWDENTLTKNSYSTANPAKTYYGSTFTLDGYVTPEPSSFLLLGSGLLGLAGVLRRKLRR